MAAYIIRRLLILPILVLGVSLLIFAMYAMLDVRERASLFVRDVPKTKDALERIIKKYGLDDPIPVQYWRWLVGVRDSETGEWHGGVIRGNLGWSKTAQRPVFDALLYYLPATAELALWSIIPVILIGIWLGVKAAVKQDRFVDHFARVFAIVGWSFPTFVFGLLALMLFYAKLQWFPPGRLSEWALQETISANTIVQYTRMNTIDGLLNGRLDFFWDALRHLILPVITLSYLSWALILRVTRSSMLETLRQEYVTVARAKGLTEREVINKHAKRNALIPVATIGGLTIIGLLNGVVITETVFNYRGLGYWAANAALSLDIISVLGFTLFNGVLLVVGNLIVDVLYAFIDPRVRLE
jgi:peptide/nickel transport system permease protein